MTTKTLFCSLLISLFFLTICPIDIQAQLSDAGELPKKYREVFLGFGPRSLDTEAGSIVTQYVDDSPSMDSFNGTFEVADGYNSLGVQLGYKFGKYNGLSHKILVDVNVSENVGGVVAYGLGWNISRVMGNGILTINPGLFAGFANYGFAIGSLENNAGFIQIGEVQYFDESLDMQLRSQLFLFGPELGVDYTFTDRFKAWINVAYDVASGNSRPELEFTGADNSSRLALDTDNPSVSYNGEAIEALPYEGSGLRLSVGVSYVWNWY